MTKTLETGDILQISNSKRMVYLGDDMAIGEQFYPVSGEWRAADYHKPAKLTEQQINFWLSKK